MLRRKRVKLLRIIVAALLVLLAGAALLPASLAHAASTVRQLVPSTPEELHKLATHAEARAAHARKLADQAETAAATAEANLRLAESNFNNIRRLSPITPPRLAATPQLLSPAVNQAQTQLQFAQQRQQRAALGTSTVPFGPRPIGAPSSPILNTIAQSQLQSARTATFMAQQNLAAARQTANMDAQAASLGGASNAARVSNAQLNLSTARSLAEAAQRAAKTAELNAQTLAEDADRARAATAIDGPH